MFRAGLALAALGLMGTLWPAPGARAYATTYRISRSRYHLGPRVAIDLGHFNNSPADARFLALSDLLVWDGYRAARSKQYLVPEYLKDIRILVIGNAMPYPAGFKWFADAVGMAGRAAFGGDEIQTVRGWVRGGGSLLLEADVPGSGRAAAPLAAAFGLQFHDCSAPVFLPKIEVREHAIRSGRSEYGESIENVAALANGWIDSKTSDAQSVTLLKAPANAAGSCTAGKPLALASEFGRGRVVALSAQLERNDDLVRSTGVDPRRADNRQFVLNSMHWLSRAGN
jgi:hypothetical protein